MKICVNCKGSFSLRNFSGDNSTKDRFNSRCKKCINKYSKDFRIKNGWVKKVYNKPTKEQIKEIRNKKRRERINNNPLFKLKCNTRSLLYNSFNRACKGQYRKSSSTEDMLCCSMDFFIKHIESLFKDGMSLNNYGDWHLDHITPLSNANNIDDIIKYNHYSNFQPLWAKDNILKSNKV